MRNPFSLRIMKEVQKRRLHKWKKNLNICMGLQLLILENLIPFSKKNSLNSMNAPSHQSLLALIIQESFS